MQQMRSGLLSTQMSGLQSPSLGAPQGFYSNQGKGTQANAMSSANLAAHQDQDSQQQVSKVQQTKIFNYEVNAEKNTSSQAVGFDLQPQYSIHSPFRTNEGRKELNAQHANAPQTQFDSAVRGRRIAGREVNVVCAVNSQDSARMEGMQQTISQEELRSHSPSKEAFGQNLVSLNLNTYQSLPNGLGLVQQLSVMRDKSEGRKEQQNSAQQNFKNRKASTDSNLRSGRANSQGRSDKKRGKSTSNSNSRSKQSQERIASNQQSQTLAGAHNKSQSALKRPNSAKNLKQTPSIANMHGSQKMMITSPTLTVLQREPSQGNFLPPKPKPIRNQTQAKLPLFMYQSVGSHPTTSAQQSQQYSQSHSKRAPSTSTDRKSSQNPTSKSSNQMPSQQLLNNPQILVEQDNSGAFSPVRKNMHHLTQPTSNTKGSNSGAKKRQKSQSKKNLLSSNKKNQQRGNNLFVSEQQQLLQLSPNIGRIRAELAQDLVINEEIKEDSWKQSQKIMSSFDQSEIKPHKENLASIQGDMDSSLSFRLQQQKQRLRQMNENTLPSELFKSIKQQIQNAANPNDEEKKRRKLLNDKKDKLNKVAEKVIQPKKFNMEQMRDQLSKKLETKNLANKIKKPVINQQDQQVKEQEMAKIKKQQQREQWQKEREERHECLEIVKDAIKQNIQQNSNSISRKRDPSKNAASQRPFSAKTTSGEHSQQQLLIKVPPVQEENPVYDAVYSQIIIPNTETSPLKDNKYEHAKASTISGTVSEINFGQKIQIMQETAKPALLDFVKKQKRERSKKKKLDILNEVKTMSKKERALKNLEEQYKKNFEVFKQVIGTAIHKGKLKKHKNLKSTKNIDPNNLQPSIQQIENVRRATQRSKSKRRLDEEKENRRMSLSPGEGLRESRSGTRSRSDKKIKQKTAYASTAHLKQMQQNVLDILAQSNDKNLRNLASNVKGTLKYTKSQTVADLHQNVEDQQLHLPPKNQIIISKQQLKSILLKQKADSKPQSNYDGDSFSRHDHSFTNQQQQLSTIQGENKSKNILMISHPQSLKHLMSADPQMLQSDNAKQQELTPIVLQKRNNFVSQAIGTGFPDNFSAENKLSVVNKPGDSLQSFQFGMIPFNSMSQSREDISIFRTQDRLQLEQQQQHQNQMHDDYRSVSSLQNNQQREEYFRSRSGSVEGGADNNQAKNKSAKKRKNKVLTQQQMLSPTRSNNPADGQKALGSGQKSKKKQQRKGSAGTKKNLVPQQQQPMIDMNILKQVQQQVNKQLPQRPKSANVQLNIIDFVQQQQLQQRNLQEQLEKKNINEIRKRAAVKTQKYLKGYLARKGIRQLRKEKEQVERDFKLVKQMYWSREQVPFNQEQLDDKQFSSVGKVAGTHLPELNFNNNINILNEESKVGEKSYQSQSSSQFEAGSSKLSRSEANLKSIIAQEQEKLRKQNSKGSRPNSSEAKGQQKMGGLPPQSNSQASLIQNEEMKIQPQKRISERNSQNQLRDDDLRGSRDRSSQPSNQQNKNDFELPRQSNDMIELNRQLEQKSPTSMRETLQRQDIIPITPIKNEESKKETYLYNVQNETSQKQQQLISQLHKQMTTKIKPRGQSEDGVVGVYSNSQNYQAHSNSQIFGSEERDMSWQFDRRSFQEFFEHNSQILQEESKRRSLGPHNQGSGSKQSLSNKLNQYETYLQDMEKKTEKGKEELKKLQERRHLSPASQKKKSMLEKWVTKQEEKLSMRKKWINENVNEMIAKMDQDLQNTKKKIGSGRKGSLKFGDSHDWSQVDMSIGHITSSSVHSTPRIYSMGIGGQIPQQLPTAQQLLNNNKTDREKPTKLFDYKLPLKNHATSIESIDAVQKPFILEEDGKEHGSMRNRQSSRDSMSSKLSEQRDAMDKSSENYDILNKHEFPHHQDNNLNIFRNNLEEERKTSSRNTVEIVSASMVEDLGNGDEDDENESLSKMEPPQFQSPTISTISPNQQMKDYFSDEDEKATNVAPPFMLYKEIADQHNDRRVQQQESEEAFLSIKEPEQPITFKQIQELKEVRENQTESITDFVMGYLLDSMKQNLFPKRVVIPIKSPVKEDDLQGEQNNTEPSNQLQEFVSQEVPPISNDDDVVEEVIDADDENRKKAEEELRIIQEQIQQQMILKQKKRIRGIKTNMRIVDTYVGQVFKKVKDQEDEFIENLSTPLNKDPLEILLHLQNVFVDTELENAIAFQQSVLPVDLYLDIERNKADVQQAENSDQEEQPANKSMMGEWENIHNKVIFDAINEALDNYRPYGLRGPPMPWSQQTRTLTYKNGQQVDQVLRQVRLKVMEWARTFAGALSCSELLMEYGIKGPLDEDKLTLLREERLALVLAAEIEENEMLWTDYEYEETQTKLDVADMILEFLAEEAAREMNRIQQSRQGQSALDTTNNTSIAVPSNLNV